MTGVGNGTKTREENGNYKRPQRPKPLDPNKRLIYFDKIGKSSVQPCDFCNLNDMAWMYKPK